MSGKGARANELVAAFKLAGRTIAVERLTKKC
jgi:hypothetical protein